jgi:hypothetical protein
LGHVPGLLRWLAAVMADPQALAAALMGPQPGMMGSFAPQQNPQMMGPIAQPQVQPSAYDQYQAQMRMMQAAQQAQRLSNTGPRDINPGATWGGQDRNAMRPGDVATSRMYGVPENI